MYKRNHSDLTGFGRKVVNRLRMSRARRSLTGVILLQAAIGMAGCNVDRTEPPPKIRTTPRTPSSHQQMARSGLDLSISDQREVDLVEDLVAHRTAYLQTLETLRDYYRARGYADKQSWADYELKGVRGVRSFKYVLDAEVPAGGLRPVSTVDEADALYNQGIGLMKKGGHGVPVFYRERVMVEAAEKFRTLVSDFPQSDKIDDAAFQLGEIHKEYLRGQEPIAVKWYERAMEWDPKTPHPVRFQAAVVYDYRLHDRDRALELYQAVVREDEGPRSNVRFAAKRIEELIVSQRTADARQPS